MILKSLRLKNIRSYTDQRIEFPKGSILLAGDIGSGKSSILQAVEFALFGARRDSSGDALLRKGEREGEVELSLELDGSAIIIQRRLKRQKDSVGQESGFIMLDGNKTEGTAIELKSKVLGLIGYPKELLTKSKSLIYRFTVYTPQEEMKQILSGADEERIDTLRKVFGIDRYKNLSRNAELYIRSIKEKKKELSGIMLGLDEKKKEVDIRKADIDRLERSRLKLLPLLDRASANKAKVREEIAETEKKMMMLHELRKKVELQDARFMEIMRNRNKNKSDLDAVEASISSIKSKLQQSNADSTAYPAVDVVEKEISAYEKDIAILSRTITELSERRKHVDRRAEELKKEIEAKSSRISISREKEILYKTLLDELKDKDIISKAIEEVGMKLKDAEMIIVELDSRKRQSESLKDSISSMDVCPTCRQEVSLVHKQAILQEEERKISKISSEMKALNTEKERIKAMLNSHDNRLKILNEKERRLAAVDAELANANALKTELESIKKSRATLDTENATIISALAGLDQQVIDSKSKSLEEKKALLKAINRHNIELKEIQHNKAMLEDKQRMKDGLLKIQDQIKEEIKQVNIKKLKLNDEICRNLSVEVEFKQKRVEFEKLLDEEKKLELRLGELSKEIEGISRHVSSLDNDIMVKENAFRRHESLTAVQEWLEKMFLNLMMTMEKHIMARVHTQFSELFSKWFSLLIEDQGISVRIDESFSPIINQNGHDTNMDHLSGGEKTSIALAYRLALNKVINDMMSSIKTRGIIMLDEPTDGFSSEQLDKVRTVLEELDVKQMIIVSHESKIESFVEHIIRVQKDEHVSKIIS